MYDVSLGSDLTALLKFGDVELLLLSLKYNGNFTMLRLSSIRGCRRFAHVYFFVAVSSIVVELCCLNSLL